MKNVAASLVLLTALTGCNHSQYDNNPPEPTPKPDVKPTPVVPDVKPTPKPDVKPKPVVPDVKPTPKPDVKPSKNPDLIISGTKEYSSSKVDISIAAVDGRKIEKNTKVTVSCNDRNQTFIADQDGKLQPFGFYLMPWMFDKPFKMLAHVEAVYPDGTTKQFNLYFLTKPLPKPELPKTATIEFENVNNSMGGDGVVSKQGTSPMCKDCNLEHKWIVDTNNNQVFGDDDNGIKDQVTNGQNLTFGSGDTDSRFVKSISQIKQNGKVISELINYYKSNGLFAESNFDTENFDGDLLVLENGDVHLIGQENSFAQDVLIGKIDFDRNNKHQEIKFFDRRQSMLIATSKGFYNISKIESSDLNSGKSLTDIRVENAPITVSDSNPVVNLISGAHRFYMTIVELSDGTLQGWNASYSDSMSSSSSSSSGGDSFQFLDLKNLFSSKVSKMMWLHNTPFETYETEKGNSLRSSRAAVISTVDGNVYLADFGVDYNNSDLSSKPTLTLLSSDGIKKMLEWNGALYILNEHNDLWVGDLSGDVNRIKTTFTSVGLGEITDIDSNGGTFIAKANGKVFAINRYTKHTTGSIGIVASEGFVNPKALTTNVRAVFRYGNSDSTEFSENAYGSKYPVASFAYLIQDTNGTIKNIDASSKEELKLDPSVSVVNEYDSRDAVILELSDGSYVLKTDTHEIQDPNDYCSYCDYNPAYIGDFSNWNQVSPSFYVLDKSASIKKIVAMTNGFAVLFGDNNLELYTTPKYQHNFDTQIKGGNVALTAVKDIYSSVGSLYIKHNNGFIDVLHEDTEYGVPYDEIYAGYKLKTFQRIPSNGIH
ncbi:hypothetical protein [Photobacterium damselae]|uniref:hypothetical protein n=1 Tax=Photobacterium damselae TaxID=38293 RepID=UPI001F29A8D8|nr:hypothetical protein [Photobacterium damselae]UKA04675.1 hypothetical protein IHC89_23945 [Photobacterium damselae subsp. damselae]